LKNGFWSWALAFYAVFKSVIGYDKDPRPKTQDQSPTLKEVHMPSYIALLKYTAQGIGNIKDSPRRLDAGRKSFKKLGVKLKETYLTMGRYDHVCIFEAPDDASFAKAILTLGSLGNVHTESFQAFSEAEFREICDSIE
jgi:uncharacterized protein with GYD domain